MLRFKADQMVVSLCGTVAYEKLDGLVKPVPSSSVVTATHEPAPNKQALTVIFPPHQAAQELFAQVGTVVPVKLERSRKVCYAATALMGTFFANLQSATQ